MDMDANEIVTITYNGGGTHKANISCDSAIASMRDILIDKRVYILDT